MRNTTGTGWLTVATVALLATGCSDDGPVDPPPPPPPAASWSPAFDATDVGWMMNVWGPSADDLYAVGGSPDAGTIRHWDGVTWSERDPGVAVPLLNWVHGFGPDDITIVGSGGTVLHWDGAAFTLQETPTEQNLWGVWGTSPDDLWAVGGDGFEETDKVILHYDGSTWTEEPLPDTEKVGVRAFFKVWGTSASDVYVVGSRGVVLHYDGSAWAEELVGASDDLVSLWGTGPDDIVAVGGRGNGIVSRFDGSEWRTENLAPLPGFNGVFTREAGTATVVGQKGTIITVDLSTFDYETDSYDTSLDLHAVFGDDSGRLTAVGGSLASTQPPYRGIALWIER